VFDGHFDGMPVLAGVAQLGWAIDMARSCFSLPPGFQRVEALKFQRPVRPPVALELSLGWRSDTSQLTFQFTSAAGTHSSGRVVFGAEA
jgi:3-hydroxymyristoyl/3-hydroxydecanoyl-(acyl carrier protein) dehydratase